MGSLQCDPFSSELAVMSSSVLAWCFFFMLGVAGRPLHGALDVGLDCYLGLLKRCFVCVKHARMYANLGF